MQQPVEINPWQRTTAAESAVQPISARLRWLMAVGCGASVANIYYCQPLLGAFSRYFHVSEAAAGNINILTQIGYGLGMLFILPLGDKISRRRLILALFMLSACVLGITGLSTRLWMLDVCSVGIGLLSVSCHVLIPYGAHLSSDAQRGRTIGALLGGLLVGILVSRTLSGWIAQYLGWRWVYETAALLMLGICLLLWLQLPDEQPAFRGSYIRLLRSVWELWRQHAVVRQSAWIGATLFGAISAFWATMAFFLEAPPYQYPLSWIGMFGLVGAGGAMAAPLVGRITDRKSPLLTIQVGILLVISGYLILFFASLHIALVVIGVILLDVGLQAAHVSNQARNYAILPHARTRLNTIYMTAFFGGGTLGSVAGNMMWNHFRWTGVCMAGLVMAMLSWLAIVSFRKQKIAYT
ncbi:putative MFS family arabinose efflux permease [Thermoflavifilum aggregans]|uniref:Putative MFS family arabinose efflux permease n=1 Tax=Thermoflavifilum aggregans TaxID=454188 RepID=A0A2M9CWX6_9BACT|nr:MFS transporter [Thermoflavifilum aggregans]PJJ76375.1 putative MFS family arabinose efflux permease [Thermoflavifilum aggregans]